MALLLNRKSEDPQNLSNVEFVSLGINDRAKSKGSVKNVMQKSRTESNEKIGSYSLQVLSTWRQARR